MNENHITVAKTARYFTIGKLNGKTKIIWFVLHGYGQLAAKFIKSFKILDDGTNYIIAPEGLHRFYWEGFSDKVVASWMTKEDRENDIKDYINYLDRVYELIMKENKPARHGNIPITCRPARQVAGGEVKVNILGFSQGVATASRWIASGKVRARNFIAWSGALANDIDYESKALVFNKMSMYLVIGRQDEWIKEEHIKQQEKILKKGGINYELTQFEGGHEIDESILQEIAQK